MFKNNVAELAAFEKNRALEEKLSKQWADLDRKLDNNLYDIRSLNLDSLRFIQDVKKSTGYFLPAWWQEEKTKGVDEMRAKRLAATVPFSNASRIPKKPLPKLKEIRNLETNSRQLTLIDKEYSSPEIENPQKFAGETIIVPTGSVIIGKTQIITKTSFANLTEKTMGVPLQQEYDETTENISQPNESDTSDGVQEEQTATVQEEQTARVHEEQKYEQLKVIPPEQLPEKARTLSKVRFEKLLNEVNSTNIVKWLPDYTAEYMGATRKGPSLKQVNKAASRKYQDLDSEGFVDLAELKAIVRLQNLESKVVRHPLTRMFGKRHRKSLQKPNYGLSVESDGSAILEKRIGKKMREFRQHYPTYPELLVSITEDDDVFDEKLKPEGPLRSVINRRNRRPSQAPRQLNYRPLAHQTFESRLLRLREDTKLPFLQQDSTASSLIVPEKHRERLRHIKNPFFDRRN